MILNGSKSPDCNRPAGVVAIENNGGFSISELQTARDLVTSVMAQLHVRHDYRIRVELSSDSILE